MIALIFLFVGLAKAQTTYPINDPRNPNCPCHKYQKQAEEEYKKLLGQNNAVKDKPIDIISNKPIGINNINKTKLLQHVGQSGDELGKLNKISNDDQIALNSNGKNLNSKIVDTPISLQGETNNTSGNLNTLEQNIERSGSVTRSPQYITAKHWKGKRKKHTAFYKQMKRIFDVGSWDIWKGKRITSACYHWR